MDHKNVRRRALERKRNVRSRGELFKSLKEPLQKLQERNGQTHLSTACLHRMRFSIPLHYFSIILCEQPLIHSAL